MEQNSKVLTHQEAVLESKVDLVINLQKGNLQTALKIAQSLRNEAVERDSRISEMIRLIKMRIGQLDRLHQLQSSSSSDDESSSSEEDDEEEKDDDEGFDDNPGTSEDDEKRK